MATKRSSSASNIPFAVFAVLLVAVVGVYLHNRMGGGSGEYVLGLSTENSFGSLVGKFFSIGDWKKEKVSPSSLFDSSDSLPTRSRTGRRGNAIEMPRPGRPRSTDTNTRTLLDNLGKIGNDTTNADFKTLELTARDLF